MGGTLSHIGSEVPNSLGLPSNQNLASNEKSRFLSQDELEAFEQSMQMVRSWLDNVQGVEDEEIKSEARYKLKNG